VPHRIHLIISSFVLATVVALPYSTRADDGLDSDLLEDLDSDLLEGLDDIPELSGDGDSATEDNANSAEESTDSGEPVSSDPLTRVSERMRQVEIRIADQNTATETQQIQKKIISELDILIAQMEKQCQQSSGGKPKSKPKPNQQKKPEPKPNQGEATQQASDDPASESTDRVQSAEDIQTKMEELEVLVKKVWGHLPPRVREQMQNAESERILPQYESLIEAYYQRLAEDQQRP